MALNPFSQETPSEKNLPVFGSISAALACSLILVCIGCNWAHASRERDANKRGAKSDILRLSNDQITFIETHVTNLIASEIYWSSGDDDPFYEAHAGRKVVAKYISFERAVIILVDELKIASVSYIKMPDGRLDYPGSVDFTSGSDNVEDLIRAGKLRPGNWDRFVMMLDYYPELKLAREQKEGYDNQFPSPLKRSLAQHEIGQENKKQSILVPSPNPHWITNAEITLPELGSPSYKPMTDTKEFLLARVLREAQRQADVMFEKQERATVTVPDFNVGDAKIWVLIEHEKGGGVIVSIDLTTNPKEHPVFFSGVVTYDIRANRYGLGFEAQTAKKIKDNQLKTVGYTCSNGG